MFRILGLVPAETTRTAVQLFTENFAKSTVQTFPKNLTPVFSELELAKCSQMFAD